MRRIKEVLRLKVGLGLSDTAVSRSVRIARSTVKEYLDRAAAAGLNWETAAELSVQIFQPQQPQRHAAAAQLVRQAQVFVACLPASSADRRNVPESACEWAAMDPR
jgi:hypothetical protein